MALKVIYQKTLNGFPPVSTMSYCRVQRINAGKEAGTAVVAYLSEDKQIVLGNAEFVFAPSVADGAKNFIAQAYDHLKTLPEFTGAMDC